MTAKTSITVAANAPKPYSIAWGIVLWFIC